LALEYRQAWYCERCKKTNSVDVLTGDGIMEIVYRIEDLHKLMSPECKQPVTKIRILTETAEDELSE